MVDNKHLFIMSPGFTGSTVFHTILSTSDRISPCMRVRQREGTGFKEIRNHFGGDNSFERWNPERPLDWSLIKSVWYDKWDTSKEILLEKSPNHMIRYERLRSEFPNSYFIAFYRNPYASYHTYLNKTNLDFERIIWDFHNRNLNPFWKIYQDVKNRSDIIYYRYEWLDDLSRLQKVVSNLTGVSVNLSSEGLKNSYVRGNAFKNSNPKKIAELSNDQIEKFNKAFIVPNLCRIHELGYKKI